MDPPLRFDPFSMTRRLTAEERARPWPELNADEVIEDDLKNECASIIYFINHGDHSNTRTVQRLIRELERIQAFRLKPIEYNLSDKDYQDLRIYLARFKYLLENMLLPEEEKAPFFHRDEGQYWDDDWDAIIEWCFLRDIRDHEVRCFFLSNPPSIGTVIKRRKRLGLNKVMACHFSPEQLSELVRALCEREGYILNVADARRLFKLERIFPTHAQTLQALQIAYGEGSYKKDIEFAQE